MSARSGVGFLVGLAVNGVRLGCVRLVLFTIVGFPYLLALQKRAHRPPKTPAAPNPFTYRLQ
jgi:hypothetical protein